MFVCAERMGVISIVRHKELLSRSWGQFHIILILTRIYRYIHRRRNSRVVRVAKSGLVISLDLGPHTAPSTLGAKVRLCHPGGNS